jgi:hypothetical protein
MPAALDGGDGNYRGDVEDLSDPHSGVAQSNRYITLLAGMFWHLQ